MLLQVVAVEDDSKVEVLEVAMLLASVLGGVGAGGGGVFFLLAKPLGEARKGRPSEASCTG